MAVTFACPECGTAIEIAAGAVGRRARCAQCLTLVEVPFLPRPARRRRGGNARQWAIVAIGFLVALLASFTVYAIVSGNLRAERQRVFATLLREAVDDAGRQDWANAVRRADAALELARMEGLVQNPAFEEARQRRTEWLEQLERQRSAERLREAESNLTVARASAVQPRPDLNRALDACEAAISAAAALASDERARIESEARDLAASIIRARGVVLRPVAGTYAAGEMGEAYASAFWPPIARALDSHGFITKRAQSALAHLWDRDAPYQLYLDVKETFGPPYMTSALLTTRIDMRFSLRASQLEMWKAGLTAQTRVPSSRFSAFESGYLAAATRRDATLEKRLRDDAFEAALGMLGAKLSTMPNWTPLASPGG